MIALLLFILIYLLVIAHDNFAEGMNEIISLLKQIKAKLHIEGL